MPELEGILDRLGADQLKGISSVTGLEKTHCVTRTWIELGAERSGLLDIIEAKTLTADDLAPIPADATIAMAIKLDVAQTIQRIVALVAQFEPQAGAEFEREMAQAEISLGFHVINDLAKSVGDRWCLFQSPGQGGPLFTGWTAVVSVRDSNKLKDVAKKIAALARQEVEQIPQGAQFRQTVTVEEVAVGGETMYFMNSIGMAIPFAPAWCVTDNELIVSLYPQGITEYFLQRGKTARFAELPQVKARLAENPLSLTYYDSKVIFDSVYPLALMGATMMFGELQREGINLNINSVPPASSISRHMQPASASIRFAADGIEMYSSRTLPIALESFQALALPMLFFVGVSRPNIIGPAAVGVLAPRRARENAATNNLKQLGLAMHNYHDTFNRMPGGGLDEKGKAKLSWRVHLLPFLEQAALYNQFNMDEPWDSETNKPLIDRMPAVFKAPGSEAKAGLTNYVALRHENAVITGKEGKRFADIVDGTSNTLMVVEADDKQAVTWTKPDDLDFDPKKPHTGLGTLRNGQFLVLFCDGSVRFISSKITADMLNRLVDRQDGKPIDTDNLELDEVPPKDGIEGAAVPNAKPQADPRVEVIRGDFNRVAP